MSRWWAGAQLLLLALAAFLGAMLIVMIPLDLAKQAGIIEGTTWTYAGCAVALAPFIAGTEMFRALFAAVLEDIAESLRKQG